MNWPVGGRRLEADEKLLDDGAVLDELDRLVLEFEESIDGSLNADERLETSELRLLRDEGIDCVERLELDESLGPASDDPVEDESDEPEAADALDMLLELLDGASGPGPGPGSCWSGPGSGEVS